MKVYSQEEVDAYGKMLNIPAELNDEPNVENSDDMIVLIDTPSIRTDGEYNDILLEKIETIKPDVVFLVFSARSRSADLVELIDTYNRFSPTYLIASHLDETDRWGGIMTMAEYLKTPVAFVTDTPGGLGQLSQPDPTILADCLLRMEVNEYDQ
jgi:flagellar biosynthesis GTPase FlhF